MLEQDFFALVKTQPQIIPEVIPEIEPIILPEKPNLEFLFVELAGYRMADFKVLEQVGRVYFCRFLPFEGNDPTLPYVLEAGEEFNNTFKKSIKVMTDYPNLDNTHAVKEVTGLYNKTKKSLQSQLTRSEFNFYTTRMEEVITNPMSYMPLYLRNPGLFYFLFYGATVVVILALLFLVS